MNPPPSAPRPTLRSLAALAGVTSMTVSLALRNHPSISEATRARLKRMAEEQGYRPDPTVAQLMHHLRKGRSKRAAVTICALHSRGGLNFPFATRVVEGARMKALQLGFAFDTMEFTAADSGKRRVERQLRSRGTEGVLLLPMSPPQALENLLAWERYAVVAATSSVLAPRFHAAVPNRSANMRELCGRLTSEGCRRLGLVTLAEHDARVNHQFTSTLLWHNHFRAEHAVPPLVTAGWPLEQGVFRQWLARYEPDALISDSEGDLERIEARLKAMGYRRCRLVSTSVLARNSRYGGIMEEPEQIGAAAIEIFTGNFYHGERGVPASARTTLIDGKYFRPNLPEGGVW